MRIRRRDALGQLFAMCAGVTRLGAEQGIAPDDPVLEPANVMDFARLAQTKLDPVAWDYLEGGSEDEVSLRDSREAFNRIIIRPRALVDVHEIDLSLELFGKKLSFPIILDPAGGKDCFHRDGEMETAKAAAAAKAIHITNGGIDKLTETGKGPVWWQVTTGGEFRTARTMTAFVRRLENQGCSGICFTTDIMYVSHRERNIHNRFVRSWCSLPGGIPRDAQGILPREGAPERTGIYPSRPFPTPTWETVQQLRSLTKLPIVLKGILIQEDARKSLECGVDGIIVSSHGARQLDHVGGTIEALPEVVAAVDGKIPVLIDGGFRRGTDILKALALGATAVAIARPYLYGLAAFGQKGVERVVELLRTELALDMALAGAPNLAAIDRSLVRIRGGSF
ncbi:MAG: alpha-hydroxy-acid oxidizing protein [Bryobacteraceae bacterium]|nr:alpha-hydroxy-acid oxidizing protein [Bryobacteraceae bacterium]